MPLTDMELQFLTEARGTGHSETSALVDINCLLLRHKQNPTGIIETIERSAADHISLGEADDRIVLRPDRRSVLFGCGDCDQFHELMGHHAEHVDNQSHVLADNGGAFLLDPRIRVIKQFNTSDYWRQRLCGSLDLKFSGLDEQHDPELFLYIHLPCGQARQLKMSAYDVVMAGCKAKQIMKRLARVRREARNRGEDVGRPFRTALLMHVDYGDGRKRIYYVRRQLITPIAVRYAQLHRAQLDQIGDTIAANS